MLTLQTLTFAISALIAILIGSNVVSETERLSDSTLRSVEATERMAIATEKLVEEAVRDRHLAWHPHLELCDFKRDVESGDWSARIRNSGSSPVIGVHFFARGDDSEAPQANTCCLVDVGGIQPGADVLIEGKDWANGEHGQSDWFSPYGEDSDITPEVALFCSDALGRRFRFVFYKNPNINPGYDRHRMMPVDMSEFPHTSGARWTCDPLIFHRIPDELISVDETP